MIPFIKSAALEDIRKSGDTIEVLIVANSDQVDEDGDRFLPEAWTNPEDVSFFKSKGVIDYNHFSKVLKVKRGTPQLIADGARNAARAIMGEPIDMWVEGGRLFCKSKWYPENDYVREVLPALKAGSTRYGASVGCVAWNPSEMTKSKYGAKVYDRARLDHIAICPLAEAKNDGTRVELLKSAMAAMILTGEDLPEANPAAVPTPMIVEPTPAFMNLAQRYLMRQPDFLQMIYTEAESMVDSVNPDFDKLRAFFLDLGISYDESSRIATDALMHFIEKQKGSR